MCYCINPCCRRREIIDSSIECPSCHTALLIKNRYILIRPLRALETAHPYAEIFEIEDIENNRERKVLKIFLRADCTHLGELFQQEATLLTSLIHSGIPKAEEQFSVFLSNGQELRCLVMEKIAGQNLEQWLKQNQQISQKEAINWLKQLIKILDYVHQEGFFHRDIKPSNIMRRPDGQLVLIDFGTARKVTETVINGSHVTVVYSDGYTAVEQIQGRAVIQSDFFAIGRTFVYLLTGKHPNIFSRDSRPNKLAWRDSAPQVSQSFADLIDKLMDLSVQNRPKNTQVILQLIDNLDGTISPPPNCQASRRSQTIAGLFFGLLAVGFLKWRSSISPSLPQLKHQDNVNAVAFSPDGKYLATASLDRTAQVWNISSHREVANIQHRDSVVAIAFSPDGKYLATASLDGTAKIQEIASGKITATLKHKDGVVAVAFSRDGEIATASADGTAQVWTTSGKPVGLPLKHSAYVRTVTFSPDGKHLATTSLDNTARVWEMTSSQGVKPVGHPLEHEESVMAVAFSPDGKKLATVSADGIAKMWEVPSGKLLGRPLESKNGLISVVFSPDGKKLATVSADGTAQLWNIADSSEILPLQKDNVNAIAFSPNGKYLAIARRDNTTRVLAQKGSSYQEVVCQQHKDRVVAVTFSPDSKYLATASWDNTARVWEVMSRHAIGCQK